jgi:hypothetical protein
MNITRLNKLTAGIVFTILTVIISFSCRGDYEELVLLQGKNSRGVISYNGSIEGKVFDVERYTIRSSCKGKVKLEIVLQGKAGVTFSIEEGVIFSDNEKECSGESDSLNGCRLIRKWDCEESLNLAVKKIEVVESGEFIPYRLFVWGKK